MTVGMRAMMSLLLLSPSAAVIGQEALIALTPGTPVQVSLDRQAVTNSYAVDVPAGARHMRLELIAADLSKDIDLLLRAGSAFDLRTDGGIDASQLFDQAHYRSASSRGDEYLVITPANAIPLAAGRWHLSLINFESAAVDATLSVNFPDADPAATIEFVFTDPGTTARRCDISGWTDPQPRTPERGNSGTTLGEQRRLAAQEGARLLTQQLSPRVPIRVQACWSDLGDATGNSFTLAQAGPQYLFLNDVGYRTYLPSLERRFTWYSAAAAAQQMGTTICRIDGGVSCVNAFDVRATFNSKLDLPGAARFDYGFSGAGVGSSFVTVVMHEISHGLGVFGLIQLKDDEDGPIGSKPPLFDGALLWDDIYGANVAVLDSQQSGSSEFLRLSDGERAQALTAGPLLRFAGPNAIGAGPDALQPEPSSYIRLHAPFTLRPGSTYSHIASNNYGQQLMQPSVGVALRTLGIAGGMLQDLGWNRAEAPAAQFAGAPSFMFFDPTRSGHGIDFRLISPALSGRPAEYFLGFYTFDASGNPEWYIASGPLIDGVFVPKRNAFGDSLLRQTYLGPSNSAPDSSAQYSGTVRLDFNDARLHPACSDGVAGRVLDGPLAVMSASINGERINWCMQPVVIPRRVQRDFSSIWYTPGDSGWGMALQSFDGSDTASATADGLFSVLFYPDATGKPRWAIGQVGALQVGAIQPLWQVQGYCRTCPSGGGVSLSDPIGTVTLDLVQGGAGAQGNRVSFDVTYPGSEGGRFVRSGVNLLPNSDPTLGGGN